MIFEFKNKNPLFSFICSFTVFHLVDEAARESKPCTEERYAASSEDVETQKYIDEFIHILFNKLTSHGISFNRGKRFKRRGREVTPDISINGTAFVQIKEDTGDIEEDEQLMLKLKSVIELPGILVLYNSSGEYELKEI